VGGAASQRYDLTQGDIFRKLLFVSLPVMAGQFMIMAYTLADIFWLGMLSSDAVVASSTAGMFLWMSMGLMLMVRIGTEIGVSQNVGLGNLDAARGYSQAGLWMALALGVAFGSFMIFARVPLVSFFNIPNDQVVLDAQLYLAISGFSIPFMYASGVIAGSFAGYGNTRLPFVVQCTGLVANIVLDPILIFGAGLGVAGAAYATIIARLIEFGLFVLAIKKHKNRPYESFSMLAKPGRKEARDIFRWGFPVAVETMVMSSFGMIIARMVAVWGVAPMAAQRVAFQIEALSWLVGAGFGSAMTAFVGQNFGAGKWSRIHKGFKTALASMSIWGLLVSVFIFIFAEPLIGLFLREPEEIVLGGVLLRILAVSQIPQSIEGAMAACFRGRGVTFKPSIVSIACNSSRVVLAYILSTTPLGLFGIWWAVTIGAAMRGTIMLLWFLWDRRKLPREDLVTSHV